MAVVSSGVEWFFRACLLVAMGVVFWLAMMQGQSIDLGTDRINHIIAFMVLGALGQLGFPRVHVLGVLFPLFAYGVLVEIIQSQVGRMAGMDDLVANFTGLLISAPLTLVIVHR